MDRRATKDQVERDQEETERLVRPAPKVKPPRHDKRRERVDTDKDPDLDKKDKDLPAGIRRVVKVVNGKKYKFIEASWSPQPNVQKKRHFAVEKYGLKKALSLALAERKAGLAEMANR